jgi:hypothetical protein
MRLAWTLADGWQQQEQDKSKMDVPQLNKWTPSDAAGVQQFLSTPLGQKWLGLLHNYKPRITADSLKSVEQAGITGAYSAGYELCMLQIYTSCRAIEQTDYSAKTADMTRD